MKYLTMYQDVAAVRSSDSVLIRANYRESPLFSLVDSLCCALHYVFIKYVPDLSYSKGYELRSAIRDFLEFRDGHNRKLHPALQIKAVEHIGIEEFRLFVDYLRRNGRSLSPAVRLKSALIKVARHSGDGLPLLTFPQVIVETEKPREPLSEEADAGFRQALRDEVDALYRKLEFRKLVEIAEPYSVEEVRSSISQVMFGMPGRFPEVMISPERALKTLLIENYPFQLRRNNANELRRSLEKVSWALSISSPVHYILGCFIETKKSVIRSKCVGLISYDELLELYYPTRRDQAVLALLIQRQSGWNKESVLAIDKESFVHPLSEVAHSDVVMIVSEKRKSQSIKLNFESPKLVWALSSRGDRYSAFNLINLAKKLSEPLAHVVGSAGRIGRDDVRHSSVFLCLPIGANACEIAESGPDNRVRSLHVVPYWNNGVASFLQAHNLVDGGVRLRSAVDLEGRLRVTWQYFDSKKNKHPLSLKALQMGHADIETTSVNYDSSAQAIHDRKLRYKSIQEELIQVFRENKFHGIIASTGRPKPADASFRIFTIVGHERALWACMDSSKPDYPGACELVPGERCTRLDKCVFCSRVYVMEDSLPFLMERLSTLQRAVEVDEELLAEFGDEIRILEFILNGWGSESAISAALIYMKRFDVLLPFDMRSLITYLED